MFGDCQVLSSMGGNGENSFYPPSIQNPNFNNFMTNLPFSIFPPLIPVSIYGSSIESKYIYLIFFWLFG